MTAFEVDLRALALLRIGLGAAVLAEIADRWPLLDVFYSDAGTYPVADLVEADGPLTRALCAYAWSGEPVVVRCLSVVHAALALMMTLGIRTRVVAPLCWFLYFGLTARNCSIAYIADRYLHIFLLLLMFLPCERAWGLDSRRTSGVPTLPAAPTSPTVATVATAIARCQLIWIYLDAGYGKVVDPEGAWSLGAEVPALDTIMRYTPVARALRAALGLGGLRVLSASAAWAECTLPSIALGAAALHAHRLQLACVCGMCGLHVGIALCMNNAVLLSFTACVAWTIFLPPFSTSAPARSTPPSSPTAAAATPTAAAAAPMGELKVRTRSELLGCFPLVCFVLATIAYHMPSQGGICSANGSGERLWSALLNNRWNAFTSIEDHVTW